MSAAQVTEAHRQLAAKVTGYRNGQHPEVIEAVAQLIADSEAMAVAGALTIAGMEQQIGAEVATREDWGGLIAERDELRAQVAALVAAKDKSCTAAADNKAEADQWHAELQRAEAEVERLKRFSSRTAIAEHRAERAEAELAGIRALADRRNKRDHSADTTHQLVADLDQALDIAQAERATERAHGVAYEYFARTLERELAEANALLANLQELHGCSREMVVHWCENAVMRSCALDRERAKVRTLREALESITRRVPIMASTGEYRRGQDHALEACSNVSRVALAATEDKP